MVSAVAGVIHGVDAVAELKRVLVSASSQLRSVIHGVDAVAELKPHHSYSQQARPQGVIHGVDAVAELKRFSW